MTEEDRVSDFWTEADLIHVYTRAQAIDDGYLVDVSDRAREAGFKIPVALTIAVWDAAVEWEPTNRGMQDEDGRLWDVLVVARYAAVQHRDDSEFLFQVYRVPNTPKATKARPVTLKCHCGPGDAGEPVLTILMPEED